MPELINTDSLKVTRDEATELCIHHLRLAGMFFESGSDNLKDFCDELDRIARREVPGIDYTPPWQIAAADFLHKINSVHEELK